MLDEDYKQAMHRYATAYGEGGSRPGQSPADISQAKHDELFARLSVPLKKMQAAYLLDVSKNCYPDKYMDDSMPNEEQIDLCKQDKRIKYFGKFEDKLHNVRNSNRFRYQDCVVEADNNMIKAMECIRAYNTGMDRDNNTLEQFMRGEYSKYF